MCIRDSLSLTYFEPMAQNMLEKDAKEGIEAFLEKREPKWDN